MEANNLKLVLEAVLLAAESPLSIRRLTELSAEAGTPPPTEDVRAALQALEDDWNDRGAELVRVASGYRLQVRQQYEPHVARLWEERPPRYSRALLETLALIAYRQPITRAEIEDVRGVSVSSHIIRTLLEREWVQILGHRDSPGRPAMYGTTRHFLDYFNLRSLDQLPSLLEMQNLDTITPELELEHADAEAGEGAQPVTEAGDDAADVAASNENAESDSAAAASVADESTESDSAAEISASDDNGESESASEAVEERR